MTARLSLEHVIRPEVLAMSAYKVADANGLLKLDAMENPYQWPPEMTEQWLQQLRACQLNRYPDPQAKRLTQLLKRINNLADDCSVLLGNGSDEIIQLLLMALPHGSSVLAPEPGFVMYPQIASCLGLQYHGIALKAHSFELNMPEMLRAIAQHQPRIIFLAYPNNPTGNLFRKEDILTIVEHAPGLVVLDEAYAPFANATFINEITKIENLLVMRTVSKLGLAGLRLGYIAAQKQLIKQLDKIRLPYNINILTQASTEFALSHTDIFAEQTSILCQQRESLAYKLQQLPGISPYPSKANFILFRCPTNKAGYIFEQLKTKGILIKNSSTQGGLLSDCLRVTIGKPEDNEYFYSTLTEIVSNM